MKHKTNITCYSVDIQIGNFTMQIYNCNGVVKQQGNPDFPEILAQFGWDKHGELEAWAWINGFTAGCRTVEGGKFRP